MVNVCLKGILYDQTFGSLLFASSLEPGFGRPRMDFSLVLNHIFSFPQLHFGLLKLYHS
jgi:hypothetical protein